MREYIVISDSTADLPISVVKELEVPIVPFPIQSRNRCTSIIWMSAMETLQTFMSGCVRSDACDIADQPGDVS